MDDTSSSKVYWYTKNTVMKMGPTIQEKTQNPLRNIQIRRSIIIYFCTQIFVEIGTFTFCDKIFDYLFELQLVLKHS